MAVPPRPECALQATCDRGSPTPLHPRSLPVATHQDAPADCLTCRDDELQHGKCAPRRFSDDQITEFIELLDCLKRHLPHLERQLVEKGIPPHIAQEARNDAESEAITAIFNGLPQRMSRAARRRWLYVVAYNKALSLLRRPMRTVSLPDDKLLPPTSEAWYTAHEPELAVAAAELLPTHLLAVIRAMIFDGLSSWATALRLGIPEPTVRSRKKQAIRHLRDIFDDLSKKFEAKDAQNGTR